MVQVGPESENELRRPLQSGIAPSQKRLQLREVEWLTDVHRNHDFVLRPPPASLVEADSVGKLGLSEGMCHHQSLDYEPRSIGVSSRGTAVAIGTKSGSIHLAVWEAGRKCWRSPDAPLLKPDGGDVSGGPSPVRALCFLGEALLVAGRGRGDFVLFDVEKRTKIEVAHVENADASAPPHGWFDRFTEIISLAGNAPLQNGMVALGLTSGYRIHVLIKEGDRYRSRTGTATSLGIPAKRGQMNANNDRLVGGVWAHGRLWLMNSHGVIVCLKHRPSGQFAQNGVSEAEPVDLCFPLEVDDSGMPNGCYQVVPIREPAEYKDIRGCTLGLAVRVADDISVLRFALDPQSRHEHGPNRTAPRLVPSRHWEAVPDALDFTVGMPFFTDPKASRDFIVTKPGTGNRYERAIKDNPLWVVVATQEPGLRWMAWKDDDETGALKPLGGPAPHRAGFSTVTLYVQLGWRGGEAAFLVCGDRSHEFRIVPLLESRATGEIINSAVRAVPPLEGAREPGIGWWLLREAIRENIGNGGPILDHVPAAIERRDGADLRSLLRIALNAWRTSKSSARLSALRGWIWRLLARAHELDEPGLVASLGQQVVDELSSSLVPGSAPKSDPLQAWHEVGLLAGFLRKWVVYGHTYSKKDCELLTLSQLNLSCYEHLDALTYITLLLKQKTDLRWKRRLGGPDVSTTHWALAVADNGSFSLHSDADGVIHALSEDGRDLPWLIDERLKFQLDTHGLDRGRLVGGELPKLQHARADAYRAIMRRGPYARRLLLFAIPGSEPTRYVAIFHFRGLPRAVGEHERRSPRESGQAPLNDRPRLFVLLFECPARGPGLKLLDVNSATVGGELYGLAKLELAESSVHRPRFAILAGTSGAWDSASEPIAEPFIEFELDIDGTAITGFARSKTKVEPMGTTQGGMPHGIYRPPHNPCWCLVPVQEGGETWLWAGFKDGHIRPYQLLNMRPTAEWRSGGGLLPPERDAPQRARPKRVGFQASAAVWSLCVFPAGVGADPTGGAPLLMAYGTADGVIGVMELPKGHGKAPPVHIVHTEVPAPICGLADFEEDGTRKLAAVAQNGGVSVFDVGEVARRGIAAASTFSGARLDRFGFSGSARAIALLRTPEKGGKPGLPLLMVSTSDGQVHKRKLLACRGSEERRRLVSLAEMSYAASSGAASPTSAPVPRSVADMYQCVGNDALHEWLRVLDVGGDHLQRFSIWHELRQVAAGVALNGEPDLGRQAVHFERFTRTLESLSDHAFRRRPFSRESVKILWDEGGRVANQACRLSLERVDIAGRRQLLTFNAQLTRLLDKIANRWISYAPEMESRILMQVFNAIFDWSDIALLAKPDREPETQDVVESARQFIVQSLVARVLDHSDPLVPLEAMRTINDALLRGLVESVQKGWTFSLYPSSAVEEASNVNVGWFDVVQMVGGMIRRSHTVLLSSLPLFTQAARFFALSLLLTPESSLLVLQVMSENGLNPLDDAIVEHVRACIRQLQTEYGIDPREQWLKLADQVRGHLDPELPKGSSDTWLALAGEARGTLTNSDYLLEANAVSGALLELKDFRSATVPRWLSRDLAEVRYFKHSYRFMHWASKQRQLLSGRRASEIPGECQALLRLLPDLDLFEPQRSRYRQIFEAWLKQIGEDAQFAIDNLDLVEGFNRHVYRASADDLLTVAAELALQTAPMFPGSGPVPGLREQLKRHPLIYALFDRGTRLAESSQLIEIIITIAGQRARQGGDGQHVGTIAIPDLLTLVNGIAEQQQLNATLSRDPLSTESFETLRAPGNRAIWGAILQEWFRNVWRYGSRANSNGAHGGQLCYRIDSVPRGHRIRLAGMKPFLPGLELDNDPLKSQIADFVQAGDQAGLYKELIEPLGRVRGRRYHPRAREGGSGYGLNLIFKLCEFIGLKPSLQLASPLVTDGGGDPMKLPLCLDILIPTRAR